MKQLIFKNEIDQGKIDILLSMIKSWNMEAEVHPSPKKYITDLSAGSTKTCNSKGLTLSVGLWEGRDINDKQLREKAWGAEKRMIK
jgi:hypothetical protein